MKHAFALCSAICAGLTITVEPWFILAAVYSGFAALDMILRDLAWEVKVVRR